MQRFLFSLCVLPGLVFGAWGDLFNGSDDPVMNHHVNVISGKLQLSFEDHVVSGAVPISLKRSYTNFNVTKEKHPKWNFSEGWSFFSNTHLYLHDNSGIFSAEIVESTGGLVVYQEEKVKKSMLLMKPYANKRVNSEVMNYRQDVSNNKLHFDRKNKIATLYLADGGKRIYKAHKKLKGFFGRLFKRYDGLWREYLLSEEISSSGQKTLYTYDKKTLTIQKVNPAGDKIFSELTLSQFGKASRSQIQAKTSDHKKILYSGKSLNGKFHLSDIYRNNYPLENVNYIKRSFEKDYWLESISTPGKESLKVGYYLLEKSNKKNSENYLDNIFHNSKVKEIYKGGIKVASFKYLGSCTEVTDCNDILTIYQQKKGSLHRIERYDKESNLYSTEYFDWEDGNLVGKRFCNGTGEQLLSKTFEYDEYKNLIHEGGEFSKCYKYNEKHLLIEEKDEDGLNVEFEYLDDTDLITCKRTIQDGEMLLEEHFEYDEDLLLIEKRCFDGYRESAEHYYRDSETGMIIEVDDGLQKTFYEYDDCNRLINESSEFASVSMDYDEKGRLKTKTFPLGAQNQYVYDDWGNVTELKEVGSPWKSLEYDKFNRPIKCHMLGRESKNTYDLKGNIILEEDYKGGKTRFTYDEFGRCTKKELPLETEESYEYDVCGNIISVTGPDGSVIQTTYNRRNQPLEVTYPDESKTTNIYYKNGDLKETVYQDGTKTSFEYDALHRPTKTSKGGFEENWEYEGAVLKRHIDQRGLITTFEYDEFGRKISEDFEGRTTELFYDEMGFVCEIKEGEVSTKQVHDIEGRIIETSQNGFHKTCYEYDEEGRKSRAIKMTSEGEAIDQFFYDEENRLIRHVDPLDAESQILYEDYARTEIDPLGNQTVETFDELFRTIKKEKLSPAGECLLSESFFYDKAGNVIKRLTHEPNLKVEFVYDEMGRILEEVEADKKRTTFEYDEKGRLVAKTDPNGITFEQEYDDLDRMTQMKSSDGSIWYRYHYKSLDLVEIQDVIAGKSLKRSYNKFGQLAEEVGFSGFKTSWYYDTFGRKKEIVLPDGSSICYVYHENCMIAVARYKKGELLYQHRYTKFDVNQHVEEETLPLNLGEVQSKRDLLERSYSIQSPFHKIALTFNKNSLVTKRSDSLLGDKDFDYDALSQLTKEGEEKYDFDALGNSKEHEINDLNQIVSEDFSYDNNGNLTKHKETKYKYDALNRLIEIQKDGETTTFSYDPFSRLVSKETTEYYLYDGNFEIGTIDESGKIQELKVLGLGIAGDIGATIAIEIKDDIYVPLHDLQGNIIGMVDSSGEVVEKYSCNAFGEETESEFINPWRFSSKREISGLIYFGARFYNPTLKRWITPDPLGFADSRNLYLFVQNSPVNRLDAFGLSSAFFNMPLSSNNNNAWSRCSTTGNLISSDAFYGLGNIGGRDMTMMIKFPTGYELCPTNKEREQGHINLLGQFEGLIERVEYKYPVFLYHNGMMNNMDDFNRFGNTLEKVCPKNSILIGVYNETNSPYLDIPRIGYGKCYGQTKGAKDLGAALTYVNSVFSTHAPDTEACFITHSEGASNYGNALWKMPQKKREYIANRFKVCALGPVTPILKKYGINPQNYYSMADYAVNGKISETIAASGAGLLASIAGTVNLSFHKRCSRCNINWLGPTTPPQERIGGYIDHEFHGSTYQGALEEFIQEGWGAHVQQNHR